jgi:hypothetical protein
MELITDNVPIGIALTVVILYLIDKVIGPLIKGKLVPERKKNGVDNNITKEIKEILLHVKSDTSIVKSQINDLHVWHSPNQDGVQSWRDQTVVVLILEQILKELKALNKQALAD